MQCSALLTGNYYLVSSTKSKDTQQINFIQNIFCSQATLSGTHGDSAGAGQTENDQHPHTGVFLLQNLVTGG